MDRNKFIKAYTLQYFSSLNRKEAAIFTNEVETFYQNSHDITDGEFVEAFNRQFPVVAISNSTAHLNQLVNIRRNLADIKWIIILLIIVSIFAAILS